MNIEIDGMEKLQRKLERMTREFHGTQSTDMRSAMQRSMYRMVFTLADYPPQPATSSYRRTGTLGRRWTTEVEAIRGGVQGKVGNNTKYGPYVQSERFQKFVHKRTGWITDEKALERNENAFRGEFEDAIRRMVED